MTKTLEDFIAQEHSAEDRRLAAWVRQSIRARTGQSGMGPGEFNQRSLEEITTAAQVKFDAYTVFIASPDRRYLAAIQQAQGALESARAAYCRGFGDRREQAHAVERLTEAATAIQDAGAALAAIAGVEV